MVSLARPHPLQLGIAEVHPPSAPYHLSSFRRYSSIRMFEGTHQVFSCLIWCVANPPDVYPLGELPYAAVLRDGPVHDDQSHRVRIF